MNYYYYKNCLLSVAFWGQERVLYVQEKKPFPFNLVKSVWIIETMNGIFRSPLHYIMDNMLFYQDISDYCKSYFDIFFLLHKKL